MIDNNDDWFDTQSEWIDDIARLISTTILIIFVVLFVAAGFFAWGWL